MKFNIAMIHRDLPYEYDRGGVSYHVHYLANHLAKRGHDVIVFSTDPKPMDAQYRVCQIAVPSKAKHSRLFQTYIWPWYVTKQDFSSFDVVHAHGDSQFLFSPRTPLVRTFYGSALGEALSATSLRRGLSQLSLYPFEFLSAKIATSSVAISQATLRHLPFIKTVIPCGVDLELFRPSEEKSRNPSILFVGMLTGRKRGNMLLRVFRNEVRPAIPNAKLWMVSQEKVQDEGVTWFGKVPLEKLIELYQKAWVLCLPSSYEGFGIPYIEAMACGTPVVATPNSGAREVLEESHYGIICDQEALGKTLIRVLQDQDLRRQLEKKGVDYVKQFSWTNIISSYESIYASVAKRVNCP